MTTPLWSLEQPNRFVETVSAPYVASPRKAGLRLTAALAASQSPQAVSLYLVDQGGCSLKDHKDSREVRMSCVQGRPATQLFLPLDPQHPQFHEFFAIALDSIAGAEDWVTVSTTAVIVQPAL